MNSVALAFPDSLHFLLVLWLGTLVLGRLWAGLRPVVPGLGCRLVHRFGLARVFGILAIGRTLGPPLPWSLGFPSAVGAGKRWSWTLLGGR
jgi:hypothetical protein